VILLQPKTDVLEFVNDEIAKVILIIKTDFMKSIFFGLFLLQTILAQNEKEQKSILGFSMAQKLPRPIINIIE
jgi:hypothetical protein